MALALIAMAAATSTIEFRAAGFMLKLQERVHGVRQFTDAVRAAVLPRAAPLLRRVRHTVVLVSIDDVPQPAKRDYVTDDGALVLHMQTVGPADAADRLFPDFVYGGWWHIGLHDFDAFANAVVARGAEPAVRSTAFWIGNLEMSAERETLRALAQRHPEQLDARGMRWQHERGNVTEATGERAATDAWVSLQAHAEWRAHRIEREN